MYRPGRGGSQQGFTLIELMIIVGIIGILVAIAAPNFARYQAKARQSEAKIALSAVYMGEKSFYSEYAAFVGSMDAIGYVPEGQRRFYAVGWAATHATTINGYAGDYSQANYPTLLAPYTCTATAALVAALTGDAQTFSVGAVGCVRNSNTDSDAWSMDDQKTIQNNFVAL